jgi:hypothetical protein
MDNKYITKIVYVGNYIFFINNSIGATYDDLISADNYNDYKVKLTMFMRKLKLLKLINKTEKELQNTEIYTARFRPMNYDINSLYPHVMKLYDIDQTYIRKTIIGNGN